MNANDRMSETFATFHEEIANSESSFWVTVKVTTTAHIPVLVKVTGTQDPINMITLGDVEECLPNGSYRLADWEIIATAPAN